MVELMSMVCEKLYCAALACLLSSYKSMAMFRLYLTAPRVWHVVSSRMVPLQSRRYGSSKQSLNKARFADVVSGPGPPDSTIAASTSSRRDLTSAKVLSVLAASSPKSWARNSPGDPLTWPMPCSDSSQRQETFWRFLPLPLLLWPMDLHWPWTLPSRHQLLS